MKNNFSFYIINIKERTDRKQHILHEFERLNKLNFYTVATDSGFLGNVVLPAGLTTVYHRHIQFRNGLRAQAVIITKQMRLLQRFYFNMVKKINNK